MLYNLWKEELEKYYKENTKIIIDNELKGKVLIEGNTTRPYYLNYDNIFVYGLAGIKELDTMVSSLSNRLNPRKINE